MHLPFSHTPRPEHLFLHLSTGSHCLHDGRSQCSPVQLVLQKHFPWWHTPCLRSSWHPGLATWLIGSQSQLCSSHSSPEKPFWHSHFGGLPFVPSLQTPWLLHFCTANSYVPLTFFPHPLHVVISQPAPVKPSLHMHSLLPVWFIAQEPWLLQASTTNLFPAP